MDINLPLNLVRVTEAAAIRSFRYMGLGDKNAADQAAVDAMHLIFNGLDMDGTVVIGEGEIDEAPMLYIGEKLGTGREGSVKLDIAVDPVEGTNLVAKGQNNAISVIAAAPKGCLLNAPDMYMEKIACGPEGVGSIHLDLPIEENIRRIAKIKNKEISETIVMVQDRARHKDLVEKIRNYGSRVKLFNDGDVNSSISTCFKRSGVDLFVGIGGAPEGVISAAAIKSLGGLFQGRLKPRNDEEISRCKTMGINDINKLLSLDDLVKGNEALFAATGITDGEFLNGVVQYPNNTVKTHSIMLRAETGTIRFVEALHKLDNKPQLSPRNSNWRK
ncbi:class II fructose-bisphosphatase [Miniphocaeibacter massiliensis]|uniref:class II fructose-bisphosphatase n=1 Tax=Miniphocaeibacter massiliensis TaxID=2041841 RepID=UPI000C07C178|nr:class II fructose-bisphosphatase [Miniphocaeibacter massiliensis]